MRNKLKIGVLCASLLAVSATVGEVFASYTISDSANSIGDRITLKDLNFYLNSVAPANKLTSNGDGTWESGEISTSYGTTYQVVDEDGNNVGSSYTTTTEGTFKFTYTHASATTSVDVLQKTVYFNFLPMANGGTNGRVWNQFYCYAYKNGTEDKNAAWPGQLMTAVNSNGLYKLSIDGEYNKVIFNNGGTDESGHMIQTGDLSYDISKPQFGCTSKDDLTTYVASATPSINPSSSFSYYLNTSRDSWGHNNSKAYGLELTKDTTQYLIRCYLYQGEQFGISDGSSGWWGKNNLDSSSTGGCTSYDNNIYCNANDWYNIYFKPSIHKIYISRG